MVNSSLDDGLPSLSQREMEVLSLLGEEDQGQVAFQGIKRRLGVHQESLSRTLRRLQEDSLVERSGKGYSLSPEGMDLIDALRNSSPAPSLPILRTVLPNRHTATMAMESLRQRWFGHLRWYGQFDEPEGPKLSWTTDDGVVRLDARFRELLMSVDAQVADPSRLPEAVVAAHRLLYEVTQAYLGGSGLALPPADS